LKLSSTQVSRSSAYDHESLILSRLLPSAYRAHVANHAPLLHLGS